MSQYTQLSLKERQRIHGLLSVNVSIFEISRRLNRHRSTIYREIARNNTRGQYYPGQANQKAQARTQRKAIKIIDGSPLHQFILSGLKQGWSPEQIAGRYKIEFSSSISHESIYRFIYRPENKDYYKLLPNKHRHRYRRLSRKSSHKNHSLQGRNIRNRPDEINQRVSVGHWEGDTVRFSGNRKPSVTTLVERCARYVLLIKNKRSSSQEVIDGIKTKTAMIAKSAWCSVTFDLGTEFSRFMDLSRTLNDQIYFCDASSPWQKGTNENTNGRLRRFLPRRTLIEHVAQEALDEIARAMNNTPRKCLGFLTPAEAFQRFNSRGCRTSR